MDIYENLYNHKAEVFDLTCSNLNPCFNFNADYTINTKHNFLRKIIFDKNEESKKERLEEEKERKMENGNFVIYLLHSDLSNKTYIGKTKDIIKRKQQHKNACCKEYHQEVHNHIIETGGFDKWNMKILERLKDNDLLQKREQYWIDKLNPSLNSRNAKRKEKEKEFKI